MKRIILTLLVAFSISAHAAVQTKIIQDTVTYGSSLTIDINSDGTDDYYFFIDSLPMGELYCRVNALNGSFVLDNSTYGYADALNTGDTVTGNFGQFGLLGTFTTAGNFNGKGIKYLGISIASSQGSYFGWIKLELNQDRSQLIVYDAAFDDSGMKILAGTTTVVTSIRNIQSMQGIKLLPTSGRIAVQSAPEGAICTIHSIAGKRMLITTILSESQELQTDGLPEGIYVISISVNGSIYTRKLYLH